jgi:hypothetical protein
MLISLGKEAKRKHGDGIVTPRAIQRRKERLTILLFNRYWCQLRAKENSICVDQPASPDSLIVFEIRRVRVMLLG